MVTAAVRESPGANMPRLHCKIPFVIVYGPNEFVTETRTESTGKTSVSMTLVTLAGPAFDTVSEYVKLLFTIAVSALVDCVTTRSAWGGCVINSDCTIKSWDAVAIATPFVPQLTNLVAAPGAIGRLIWPIRLKLAIS
jgi:hypothetical protein